MGDEKWIFYIEYKKLLKKAKNTADYTKDSVLHLKKQKEVLYFEINYSILAASQTVTANLHLFTDLKYIY